jgi:hypothetical protein
MRLDLSTIDKIRSNFPELLTELIVRLVRWVLIVVLLIVGDVVSVCLACMLDKEYLPHPGPYMLS